MPASFILDEVDGSELDLSLDGISRRIRTGRVKGLGVHGTTTVPDPKVLEKVLMITGFPQVGDLYPGPNSGDTDPSITVENLRLKRIIIRPKTYNSMNVALVYETTDNQYSPGAYLIRDDTRTFTETTNMIPGSGRKPIRLNWVNESDSTEFIPEDYPIVHYDRPIRSMSILATIYGPPPTIQRDMVGTVNDDDWCGYDPGWWKVDRFSTESRDRGSSYQVTAEVSTKKNEDWSTYSILQNRHTGQYVPISDSNMALLVAQPYLFGYYVIPDRGAAKIGMYDFSAFDVLFGFTSLP